MPLYKPLSLISDTLKNLIDTPEDAESDKSYLTRLDRASFMSSTAKYFEFEFDDLSRSILHRIGAFQFAGVNGTSHQDKGVGGEVYPLMIRFSGVDYDLVADRFFEACKDRGRGILNHPRWGRRVVQVISCTQSEGWVSQMGEARFDVEFQESMDREFATPVGVTTHSISALSAEVDRIQGETFGEEIRIDTLDQAKSFKDVMAVATEKVYGALATLATGDDKIASIFNASYLDIVTNIDEYVSAPLRFAESIIRMVSIPATLVGRVDSKLIAYGSLLDTLPFRNVEDSTRETKNGLLTDELVGASAVNALSVSINGGTANTSTIERDAEGRALISTPLATEGYQTGGEALASALYLRSKFISLVNYLDTGQTSFKALTLSESYTQVIQSYEGLWGVVSLTIQGAINLSFQLPDKRSVILTSDSTIINQCVKYYGGVEGATLDYFIQTNELNGDEIKLLPKGKEIIYYA